MTEGCRTALSTASSVEIARALFAISFEVTPKSCNTLTATGVLLFFHLAEYTEP
jgi:hypothetical protein